MDRARRAARERLAGVCRVCPACHGRACPSGVPGMGGAGTGASFRANVQALARVRLVPRTFGPPGDGDTGPVPRPDIRCALLGFSLSLPVLAAPMCGAAFNLGGAVSEAALVEALREGGRRAGTLWCAGDGGTDEVVLAARDGMAACPDRVIPFFKPWEDRELFGRFEAAAVLGVRTAGLDLDGLGFTCLADVGRPVVSRTPRELARLLDRVRDRFSLRVLVKGIMCPDEARAAVEAGAAALVASNHGGRVLDHTPGVADILPAAVRAVAGRIPVLADGGVRTGADVLKLLALGADAVLVGRPLAVAAVGGGATAVAAGLERMGEELARAMALVGCGGLKDITPALLSGPGSCFGP